MYYTDHSGPEVKLHVAVFCKRVPVSKPATKNKSNGNEFPSARPIDTFRRGFESLAQGYSKF